MQRPSNASLLVAAALVFTGAACRSASRSGEPSGPAAALALESANTPLADTAPAKAPVEAMPVQLATAPAKTLPEPAPLAPPPKRQLLHLVTLDFPPLEFVNDTGKVDGAAVTVVREVLETLGYDAEVQLLPWARSLSLVREGRADAIFTAYRNAERALFLDYSAEVLIPQVVSLYTRVGKGRKYTGDFNALKGKMIGTVSTISYGKAFDEARNTGVIRTERVESLDLNFKKLMAGRVDYVISNRYSAQVEIERLKLEKEVTELLPPVEVTPSYIAFTKKGRFPALKDEFDKAFRAYVKSGRYQKVLEQYRVRTQNTF